ncbi:MAG: hypothetical protein JW982_15580 [Spirochaetes bacterium]|nr:hypothetical protein [Spirochaetota bacterium]
MKLKSDRNKLIKEIKSLIENFTSSATGIEDAADALGSLSESYEILRTELLNKGDTDILKSLCYQHNCSNFSIFTGIFMAFEDRILKLNYAGSQSIASKISKIIPTSEKPAYNTIGVIEINSEKYYVFRFIHNDEELIIISQSSSNYFSRDKFKYFSTRIQSILPVENKTTEDLFTIYENTMNYIDRNCNEDYIFCCYIFSFPEMMYIFGHMGKGFLKTLDGKIMKIIEHDFPESRIFKISETDYIVFEKKEKNSNLDKNITVPKVFFNCKNIPIPYTANALYVFEKNDFFKILNLAGRKITSGSRC